LPNRQYSISRPPCRQALICVIFSIAIGITLCLPALWCGNLCYSQRIDTLDQSKISIQEPVPGNQHIHSPKKATIMSAVLPGLGQTYNRKYWKLPIIYGGFAGLVYSIGFADKRYKDYKEAYILRVDGDLKTIDKYDPQLDNGEAKYSQDGLLQLKEYYRKNRDLSYILTAALYILNIIDANVDAHFFDFDISKDLTLKIKPHVYHSALSGEVTASLGLTLKL